VQVYFANIPPNPKGLEATVRIAIYAATPPRNRLDLGKEETAVRLEESPAIARFQVSCAVDGIAGEVQVAAQVIRAPRGAEIKKSADESMTVKLSIDEPSGPQ
jgi:hypothetical protein